MCSRGSLTLLRLPCVAFPGCLGTNIFPPLVRKKTFVHLIFFPSHPPPSSPRSSTPVLSVNYSLHPLTHPLSLYFFFPFSLQPSSFHMLYTFLKNLSSLTALILVTFPPPFTPSSSFTLILFRHRASLRPSSHPTSLFYPSL